MQAAVVIPAYQPEELFVGVVQGLFDVGFSRIVVVDDGSRAETQAVFSAVEVLGAHVIHHEHNRGQGAAVKTGLRAVQELWPDASGVLTCDCDGQHTPHDCLQVTQVGEEHPEAITWGIRDLSYGHIPLRSFIGNSFSSLVFYLDTGKTCPDTQTGMRFVPPQYFSVFLDCPSDRYDFAITSLVDSAKSGAELIYVPIETIYINNNEGSHFRPLHDSVIVVHSWFASMGRTMALALANLVILIALLALLPFSLLMRLVIGVLLTCALWFLYIRSHQA